MLDKFVFRKNTSDENVIKEILQNKAYSKKKIDFKIHDTVFTTVTVNKNFRTAAHYDAGDLKEGFGNLAVLQTGEYSGAYTVIPK